MNIKVNPYIDVEIDGLIYRFGESEDSIKEKIPCDLDVHNGTIYGYENSIAFAFNNNGLCFIGFTKNFSGTIVLNSYLLSTFQVDVILQTFVNEIVIEEELGSSYSILELGLGLWINGSIVVGSDNSKKFFDEISFFSKDCYA